MPKHAWSVFATLSLIDAVSNNISILEVLEQVRVSKGARSPERSLIPLRNTVVTLWTRDTAEVPEVARERLRFIDPDGLQLGEWVAEIDLTNTSRTRNRALFTSVLVTRTGLYRWEVAHASLNEPDQWTVDAALPFSVTIEDETEGTDDSQNEPQ